MEIVWLLILIISVGLLAIILARVKLDVRWFGYGLLQLVLSAIALYILNGVGLFGDFYIPINAATVATIAVLGLPGLGLIAAIKLTLM